MGNKVVGKRIETRRKQLGLTLDDIAQEIGVARSTIQRYETGSIQTIKLPVIEAIADMMSVNPAWLCGKTDDPTPPAPPPNNNPPAPQKEGGLSELDQRLNELLGRSSDETKRAMIVLLENAQKP